MFHKMTQFLNNFDLKLFQEKFNLTELKRLSECIAMETIVKS